jgi:excisionase family DNA binding protein
MTEINVVEVRPLFTVKTLASYLGCSVRKVRVLLAEGRIESFKLDRQIRVRPEAVDVYVAACEREA